MRPVLETEARPDTAEARRAGDTALGASVSVVLSLLALAAAVTARPPDAPARSGPGTPRPLLASGPTASGLWDGAELVGDQVMVATGAENGRVATIEGGESWRDYSLRTRLTWLAGRRVSLLVRNADDGSGVECELEGRALRIVRVANGVPRVLVTASVPDYRGRSFDAAVTAAGPRVTVELDGVVVASARAGSGRGTAGLAAWDPEWGRAGVAAENVRIEPPAQGVPVARAMTDHVARGE